MVLRPRAHWSFAGYAWALISASVALVFAHLTWPLLRPVPSLLFFVPIVLAAWRGGVGPALFATLLGAISTHVFLIEPRFVVAAKGTDEALRLGMFVGVGALLSVIASWLRGARRRAIEILENLSEGFLLADRESRVLYVNRVAAELIGKRAEPLIGRPALELWPEAARAVARESARGVMADGVPRLVERFDDATGRWLEEMFHRTTEGYSVLSRDVTERRRRDDELRLREAGERWTAARIQTLEERFRIMADRAPVMVWVAGPDKLVTWVNRPWLEFTGRALEQELGNGWTETIHAEDRPRWWSEFVAAFDARIPFRLECRMSRHDREYRWVLNHGVPLWSSAGEFLGYVGSCLEIHDRKLAEDERERRIVDERKLRDEVERAGRLKDQFLATLSHELRTPLQAILGWAHILRASEPPPDRVRKGIETIERNASMQHQLIEELLDMSRMISGKVQLDLQPVELPQVIEAAVRSVEPAAQAKQIELRRALDAGVGPVRADPHRIQQIVGNLLSNAIKFTPRGGKVEVALERVNAHVEVVVSDTGQGIDPELLPHVFDRFRQGDSSSTRKAGGLGLGLAIARHLAELHGGTLVAESPGLQQGSTFTLALPATPGAAVPAVADRLRVAPRSAPPRESLSLRGVKVLVVDDDADARELIGYVLRDREAEVAVTSSAAEALEQLPVVCPDVVVSDIGMPQQDGYDLIHQVRALSPERGGTVPAIALTAFARSEDRTRALMTGYQMHLSKPVQPAELIAAVASLAGKTSRR
jgi:PAS domain S-box-containing protein